MRFHERLPGGLAQRFAFAAAALVTVALLLITLSSWWLVARQHDEAVATLQRKEAEFQAASISRMISSVAARMAELSESSILATGLVDSVGKEVYLGPFLNGTREIGGIPVQILFTDFDGKEIARNGNADFSPAERAWLRTRIEASQEQAAIFPGERGPALVAIELLRYARTTTPEGALLYKVALADLVPSGTMRIHWDADGSAAAPPREVDQGKMVAPLAVPEPFRQLGLQLVLDPEQQLEGGFVPEYFLIGGIALILGSLVFVVAWRLALAMTADLRRLQAFAATVVESGIGRQRAEVRGTAEVAGLAGALNHMLDRLYEQHAMLQSENRRKDDFLAMLAHELRNPLAPISAAAQLLRIVRDRERIDEVGDIIARQVDHMTDLVDDLLDVSRVTRGLIKIERQPIRVVDVIDGAVEQVRPLVDARGHGLSVEVACGGAVVVGDRTRLVQIVANLLNNAARYTPESGRIVLRASRDGESVRIEVADNGVGIGADLLPHVFDLFTQAERSPDRSQGGLGLGLALVKSLVALHGGSVEAHSDGQGCGSRFAVVLPCAGYEPPHVAPAPPAASAPHRPLRIMIVDDNADAASSLASLLAADGHRTMVASSAEQALDMLNAEKDSAAPEVFLLDIGLPDLDGHALAGRLRSQPATARALLVAVTGYGQEDDRRSALAAGFDHYFVKPVDADRLRNILRRLAQAGGPGTSAG